MGTTFQIAEVARRSGFTPATLRYYEDIGLLTPVARTGAGYRVYDDAALERLRFIARAKQLGCRLDEIAELTRAWDGGRCATVQERLRRSVEARVADALRQIAELTTLAADLRQAATALSGEPADGPCDDTCGCTTDTTTAAVTGDITAVAADTRVGDTVTGDTPAADTATGDTPTAVTGVAGDTRAGGGGGEVPIACTLDAGEVPARLAEWRALVHHVTARHALDGGGLRLELDRDTDVAEIARLVVAERACCGFLRFALVVDDRGTALEVHTPPGGLATLTALFGAPG